MLDLVLKTGSRLCRNPRFLIVGHGPLLANQFDKWISYAREGDTVMLQYFCMCVHFASAHQCTFSCCWTAALVAFLILSVTFSMLGSVWNDLWNCCYSVIAYIFALTFPKVSWGLYYAGAHSYLECSLDAAHYWSLKAFRYLCFHLSAP